MSDKSISDLQRENAELRKEIEQLRAQPARQVGGDEREEFEYYRPDPGLLLKYARHAAWAIGGGNYSYCPASAEAAEDFFPHTWVTQAIYSAFIDGQHYQAGENNSRMQRYGVTPKSRAALAPAAVVMPDHKTCDDAPWMSADTEPDIAWRDGYNAAIDEAKSIPASLLRLIVSGNECAREIDELRALLGKEVEV